LYKLVSDYNSRYLPRGIDETLTVIDGNNYLSILASESGEHEKFQTLWYNLDTRKIEWEDNKMAQSQSPTFNFKLNTQQFKEKLGNFRFPILYPFELSVLLSFLLLDEHPTTTSDNVNKIVNRVRNFFIIYLLNLSLLKLQYHIQQSISIVCNNF